MGCMAGKEVGDLKPEVAEEAYKAAENPEIAGQVLKAENKYGIDQDGGREALLEELFDACDDDKSGALDFAEFLQLFRSTTMLIDEAKDKFEEIDTEVKDGNLTKQEFVNYHIKKFSKLSDTLFVEITQRLQKKAESTNIQNGKEQATDDAKGQSDAYSKFKASNGGTSKALTAEPGDLVAKQNLKDEGVEGADVSAAAVVMS